MLPATLFPPLPLRLLSRTFSPTRRSLGEERSYTHCNNNKTPQKYRPSPRDKGGYR